MSAAVRRLSRARWHSAEQTTVLAGSFRCSAVMGLRRQAAALVATPVAQRELIAARLRTEQHLASGEPSLRHATGHGR